MTSLIVTIGAIAWVALIGFVLWTYRRKSAERDAARAQRYQEFVGATVGAGDGLKMDAVKVANAMLASAATGSGRRLASDAVTAPPLVPASVDVSAYRRRERVLDPAGGILYYTLRAALPDHAVLTRTSLADLIEVADAYKGYERDTRVRRLQPMTVDFVICNKSLQPIAVVDLEDPAAAPAAAQAERTKADYLRAFGIRRLVYRKDALPKYPQVREQLLDPAAGP
jgi:hypothetical protein